MSEIRKEIVRQIEFELRQGIIQEFQIPERLTAEGVARFEIEPLTEKILAQYGKELSRC